MKKKEKKKRKKKADRKFFSFPSYLSLQSYTPFLTLFSTSAWNLANKISGEPLKLGSYLAHRLCPIPAPVAQSVECPLQGTGGHGFNPGPRHTKVVKNCTSCSSLGTQTNGVMLGLVDQVSG